MTYFAEFVYLIHWNSSNETFILW